MAFVNRSVALADGRLARASDSGGANVRCLHVNIL
jgi:hypothetical protein